MNVNVSFKWNKDTKKKLEEYPDKIVYAIARQTLDISGSSQITPYDTGKMERTMYSGGVKKDSQGYYIGNYTDYAMYVYKMPENTKWTRSGSKPKWFDEIWKSKGEIITNNVLKRYKL